MKIHKRVTERWVTTIRMFSTGQSSHKFGDCEVCGQHVSEVFYQSIYFHDLIGFFLVPNGLMFGHYDCLVAHRKNHPPVIYEALFPNAFKVLPSRLFHAVKKPICPNCKQQAQLIDTEQIYGKSYGYAWVCYCTPDGHYVGCHYKSRVPLGTLANGQTRHWRNLAHKTFDPLWRGKKTRGLRSTLYARLAARLGIKLRRCHIGQFDVATCKRVIDICQRGLLTDD